MKDKFANLLLIFKLLNDYKIGFFISILFSIAGGLTSAFSPFLIGKALDAMSLFILSGENYGVYLGGAKFSIFYIFVFAFFAEVVGVCMVNYAAYYSASRSELIGHGLRNRIFKMIVPTSGMERTKNNYTAGEAITLFSRDVESTWDFFGFAVNELCSSLATIVTMSIVVVKINNMAGLCLLILILSFSFGYYKNGLSIRSCFDAAAPVFDRMVDFFSASSRGRETLTGFRAQKWAHENIDRMSRFVANNANMAHWRTSRFNFFTVFLNSVFALVLCEISLSHIISPNHAYRQSLTVGSLVSLLMYLNMATRPLETLSSSAKAFSKSFISINRIRKFFLEMNIKKESSDGSEKSTSIPFLAESGEAEIVRLDRVSVVGTDSLGCEISIIKDVCFSIKSGEMVAVAGQSGSGKSTLLKIISRIIEPSSGIIEIMGRNIAMLSEDEFRNAIVYLQQDSVLFPATIRDNIKLGRDFSDSQLITAAAAAAAAQLLDNGRDDNSELAGLSGGERRRIGLSRIFLTPGRLAVLDEPSAGLDRANTDSLIRSLQTLANFAERRSVLVASHDPTILDNCDRVIFMQQGRISSMGCHRTLIQTDSSYRELISAVESGEIYHEIG